LILCTRWWWKGEGEGTTTQTNKNPESLEEGERDFHGAYFALKRQTMRIRVHFHITWTRIQYSLTQTSEILFFVK
jgi:hypothetical protein